MFMFDLPIRSLLYRFSLATLLSITTLTLAACGGGSDDGGSGNADTDNDGGDTGFALPVLLTASTFVDVNGDSSPDLIIGNQGDTRSTSDFVLINDGSGNFSVLADALPDRYLGVDGATVAFAPGEFNGDGVTDIAAITVEARDLSYYETSKVHLFLGNGDGTFSDGTAGISPNEFDGWPEWIRVADFDGDGFDDFILTTPGLCTSFCARLYLNDGAGNLAPATMTFTDSMGDYTADQVTWDKTANGELYRSEDLPVDILLGDIDNDGDPDLFTPTQQDGAMGTFLNISTPGNVHFDVKFSHTASGPYSGNSDYPQMKNGVLADFNGDGYPDVVGSNAISGDESTVAVHAFINDGTGIFNLDDDRTSTGVVHSRQWLAADIDNDGIEEVFIADHGYDAGSYPGAPNLLLVNDGSGMLIDEAASRLDSRSTYTHGASFGDIDDDGDLDLFLNQNNTVAESAKHLWLNDGNGNFTATDINISE